MVQLVSMVQIVLDGSVGLNGSDSFDGSVGLNGSDSFRWFSCFKWMR